MRSCATASDEKGLRGSTLHDYRKIGERLAERPWRGDLTWADRPLDTFSADDLLAVRRELVDAKRSARHGEPLPPRRARHLRHAPESPALAWAWMTQKVESEGKLRFYTPEQVRKLDRRGVLDDGRGDLHARDRGRPAAERDPRR